MVDEEPGVVVRLMGGLGNQLFQFAAGCAVARERGRELFVYEDTNADFSRFIQSGLHPATKRMVDRLVLNYCERSSVMRRGLWELRAHVFKADPRYFTFRQEDSFGGRDDERLFRHKGLLGMTGYFQNPEWYEPVLDEVLQILRSAVASVVRPQERTFRDELGDYTALSFRRGDYLRLGWELPIDYYEAALEALSVYPNPFTSEFTLNLGNDFDQIAIVITDINGRTVAQTTSAQNGTLTFDLYVESGVYFVQITAGNETRTVKVIKK